MTRIGQRAEQTNPTDSEQTNPRDDGEMIVGIGTDLAEVGRIRQSVAEYGDRFLNRVFTQVERDYAMRKKNFPDRLAARFAAKKRA